jgi:ribonuclease P/MRP protein subunit POP5
LKEKPLQPSLREKKRYLVYEVLSKQALKAGEVSTAIKSTMQQFVGDLGLGKAGLMFFDKDYNLANQRGFVKVSHTSLDELKASLPFIKEINGLDVIVKSVTASGMIEKAREAVHQRRD